MHRRWFVRPPLRVSKQEHVAVLGGTKIEYIPGEYLHLTKERWMNANPSMEKAAFAHMWHLLYIHASKNNTIVRMCTADLLPFTGASGGSVGYKKAKRSGYEPAYQATTKVIEKAKEYGLDTIVRFRGYGGGREGAWRAVLAGGLNVLAIEDATPIPHGGQRPRKPRRV